MANTTTYQTFKEKKNLLLPLKITPKKMVSPINVLYLMRSVRYVRCVVYVLYVMYMRIRIWTHFSGCVWNFWWHHFTWRFFLRFFFCSLHLFCDLMRSLKNHNNNNHHHFFYTVSVSQFSFLFLLFVLLA